MASILSGGMCMPAQAALSAPPAQGGPAVPQAQIQPFAARVVATRDARGRHFAVVDKQAARIAVFGPEGRLIAAAPVLLGLAAGDHSVPGVGELAGGHIPAAWRTTPAGRFASEPGRNLQGEAIVWIDYDAALAIHRLRPAPAAEHRPQRLASFTPQDNRITQGCVVVAGEFYDRVIAPTLGRQRGVVYVLPETGHWQTLLGMAADPNAL